MTVNSAPGAVPQVPPPYPVPRPEDTRPVDLWGKFDPPALKPDLLPSVIADYVFPVADQMGVDPAALAMSALTVCAASIPDQVELQMKAHDPTWKESARLWTALVGLPSTKKSPALSNAMRPMVQRDTQLSASWKAEHDRWDSLSSEERKLAPEPRRQRVRLGDTTVEAAQEALRWSEKGILIFRDEIGGWLGDLDKYSGSKSASGDKGFYLQAFNGGTYPVDRVGRGSFIIPNLSVSIVGGIQPSAIRKFAANSVDDGLLQRFLPIVLQPATIGRDEPLPWQSRMYEFAVSTLFETRATGPLRFDSAAQEIFYTVQQRHHMMQSVENINAKLAAHIGKMDGIFGRLCVVFHALESPFSTNLPDRVTVETAERVERFMRLFLLPHAYAFYAGVLGLSDEQDVLEDIAGYILAKRLTEIDHRTVQRAKPAYKKFTHRDTRPHFENLAAMNWLEPVYDPDKRNGEPRWFVNSYVHQLFAERAEREEARRLQGRATILEICGQGR